MIFIGSARPEGRRKTEELLRRQAKLLDLANDAIFVRDLHRDTIIYWNHGAARLYGWSSKEAVGAYIHEFLRTVFPTALMKSGKNFLSQVFGTESSSIQPGMATGSSSPVDGRCFVIRKAPQLEAWSSIPTSPDISEQRRF
jgi:PAS domain-containing protein